MSTRLHLPVHQLLTNPQRSPMVTVRIVSPRFWFYHGRIALVVCSGSIPHERLLRHSFCVTSCDIETKHVQPLPCFDSPAPRCVDVRRRSCLLSGYPCGNRHLHLLSGDTDEEHRLCTAYELPNISSVLKIGHPVQYTFPASFARKQSKDTCLPRLRQVKLALHGAEATNLHMYSCGPTSTAVHYSLLVRVPCTYM